MSKDLIDINGVAKLIGKKGSTVGQFTQYSNFPPVAFAAGTRRFYSKAEVIEFMQWLRMPIVGEDVPS